MKYTHLISIYKQSYHYNKYLECDKRVSTSLKQNHARSRTEKIVNRRKYRTLTINNTLINHRRPNTSIQAQNGQIHTSGTQFIPPRTSGRIFRKISPSFPHILTQLNLLVCSGALGICSKHQGNFRGVIDLETRNGLGIGECCVEVVSPNWGAGGDGLACHYCLGLQDSG